MKKRSLFLASHIGCLWLLVLSIVAQAAEMKVLSAIAVQPVMEDLGPKFERATSHKLAMTFDSVGGVVKRVQGGEPADVVVIARQGIDDLVKDGKAAADSVTVVARSFLGVAVRKGAPKPDISSPEAFKRMLRNAKSMTYSNPAFDGVSGLQVIKVFERLGIADAMKPKTVFLPKAGPVGVLVANGEAELAMQHISELLPVAGIEVVGPVPSDLHDSIVFSAAIIGSTKDAEAAKALVHFLRTPEAAAVIRTKGMERAAP